MTEPDTIQTPVAKWVFGSSLVVIGLLAAVVLSLTFGLLPAERFDGWRVPLIVALLVASVTAALASNAIIPWEKRRSIDTWKQPKVLGALTIMLIGAFGIIADVGSLLGPPAATEKKQAEIERTLERSAADANGQLSEINDRVHDIATKGSAGNATDNDPRAQVVALTGKWSVEGFVDAVRERDTDIVGKYLKSGMKATTLRSDTSAILYGFQGDMNNDPVDLLKTFQANGYKLDDELTDGLILDSISTGLPLPFDTELTPKNYTGGYQGGRFAGSLLFWMVSRAAWVGVTDQDRDVLKYLISQGADCSVARSFLDFNRESILADTAPFDELYPMVKSCAS